MANGHGTGKHAYKRKELVTVRGQTGRTSALDGKAPGYLPPYGVPCKAFLGLNAMLDGFGK